jgi:hypothetical protein
MGRTVTTPSGETWRVRRLWAPRLQSERVWSRFRRRIRQTFRVGRDVGGDVADPGCVVDFADDIAIVLVVAAAVLLLVFFVIPLVLALLDLLIVVVLSLLGIGARILFRRPWVVEATSGSGGRSTWRVVGWRASREAVDGIAAGLAHGHPPGPRLPLTPGSGPVDAPTDAPTDG